MKAVRYQYRKGHSYKCSVGVYIPDSGIAIEDETVLVVREPPHLRHYSYVQVGSVFEISAALSYVLAEYHDTRRSVEKLQEKLDLLEKLLVDELV